jgi:Protein of unknown function (DUF2590)
LAGEYDLEIVAGDLAFGPDDEPRFLAATVAVAQDVQHRLLESGLAAELVAEDGDPQSALAAIAFEVEADERIRPGTAQGSVAANGRIELTADTLDGGDIATTLVTQG